MSSGSVVAHRRHTYHGIYNASKTLITTDTTRITPAPRPRRARSAERSIDETARKHPTHAMATPASSPSLAQRVEVHGLTNALVIDATNKLLKTNSALKKLFDDGEITVKHIRKTMSTYLEVDESELKPFKAVIKDHVTELMAQEPEESVEPTADSAPEPAPEPAPAPKQKKPRAKKVAAQRTLAPEFNDTELSQKSKPLSGPPTAGDSSDDSSDEDETQLQAAPEPSPAALTDTLIDADKTQQTEPVDDEQGSPSVDGSTQTTPPHAEHA